MNRRHRIAATLLVFVMFGTFPLSAGSTSATTQVSVQVIARAIVSVDSQPAAVTITSDDIARGYVDVATPIVLRVRTNSRQGYMLQVENLTETFSSIELSTADVMMTIAAHESWIQRPYIAGGDVMPMRARLRRAGIVTNDAVFGLNDTGRLDAQHPGKLWFSLRVGECAAADLMVGRVDPDSLDLDHQLAWPWRRLRPVEPGLGLRTAVRGVAIGPAHRG